MPSLRYLFLCLDGLSGDQLYTLGMSNLTKALQTPLSWTTVETPIFSYDSQLPIMATADSHVFFLDVPGNSAGEADIYDVHGELGN